MQMEQKIRMNTRPLEGKLHEHQPIEIINVSRTEHEPLWDNMIKRYHYLGYDKMIGQRIKYLAIYDGEAIAAISYNRALLRVGARDKYIGWNDQEKLARLNEIVNNNRFLILPWVKIKNLASHLLSRSLRRIQDDWHELYGTKPFLAETFVDERYNGTCYLASNWLHLGMTKGFGKIGNQFVYHGNRKSVYIYVLAKHELNKIQTASIHRTLKPMDGGVMNMMLQVPDWNPDILKDSGITEQMVSSLGDELSGFLAPYCACVTYAGQDTFIEMYTKGLLSDLEYKSAEPIALRYDIPVRNMQRFIKTGKWNTSLMVDIYQTKLSETVSHANGMIMIDGCDIPKKGNNSVGVARQYCGSTGKTDNCQAGVFVGYSSPRGYGVVDRELYIPEKWFADNYTKLREDCGVPDDIVFKTKVEIASSLLHKVSATGLFPAKWVGVDSFFGRDKKFLASIPDGMWYFADIPVTTHVFPEAPDMAVPIYTGRGRRDLKPRPSVATVPVKHFVDDPDIPWKKVVLGEGAKGPIIADEKCIRVITCDDKMPGLPCWLYIRRLGNGSCKFSLCNAPEKTSAYVIREAAIMRWPIEQCFEECKSGLGLDQYEGRSWNTWYRHTILVFIAHLFLTSIRIKYKKNSGFDLVSG